MSYLDVPCPLCHALEGLTVQIREGCEAVSLHMVCCGCDKDTLMSGPFDEVVEQVQDWLREAYPCQITGEHQQLLKPFQPVRIHDVTIHRADYNDLVHGRKHFILLKEPQHSYPLHYGDVVRLTSFGNEPVLVRWLSYILGGYGLEPDWIIVEVKP